ncbi:MAG TPA: DUF4242 domain-containing protein [Dehalococcoidia bacterium]|jgi:hypothetical protein|nr:DUF4242 domain-containing protein [Dehalococcoidia bacterium]
MPKFMDYHEKPPPMPPEVMHQMQARIKAGQSDENGVTPLNVFVSGEGEAYCLSEAPNAEAVRKAHEAAGVPVEKIVEVNSLV